MHGNQRYLLVEMCCSGTLNHSLPRRCHKLEHAQSKLAMPQVQFLVPDIPFLSLSFFSLLKAITKYSLKKTYLEIHVYMWMQT